jgi:Leucine-rich repeat (LRR) protein
LGDNEFKYLNREEFGSLIHLEQLFLNGNQLSAITDEAFRSSRLHLLSLASNRIVRIDRSSFANSTVGDLDLSGNKFESLDAQIFTSLKRNMTRLNLSRNPRLKLSSLGILLSDHPQLKYLSLAESKYEDLPLDLFEKQRQLEFLNLSGNYLTDVYYLQLNSLTAIRVLDLSSNRLKGIDGDVLAFIDRLYNFDDLRINGNPWACDLCNIPVLLKWIQMHPSFTRACSEPYGKCVLALINHN